MPTSNLALWPTICQMVWEIQEETDYPLRILDVGPGWGKGGILLREYVAPKMIVDAVEAWQPYITPRLEAVYDKVWPMDVLDLEADTLKLYDAVLMVDVLEHIEKDKALELLERIPGWVVICTPLTWFQNPEGAEIPPELHRSLWTGFDFGSRTASYFELYGGLLVKLSPKNLVAY